MNNWFKKHILEINKSDGECYSIELLGVYIDFRQWYCFHGDNIYCYLEEILEILKYEEKKNKKRKNKLPLSTYYKVPWYKTIINWRNVWYRRRSFISFIVGIILGCLLKGI